MAPGKNGGNLGGGLGQHDKHWHLSVRGKPIALIWLQFVRVIDNPLARDDHTQCSRDLGSPGYYCGIRCWHFHVLFPLGARAPAMSVLSRPHKSRENSPVSSDSGAPGTKMHR